MTKLMLLVLFAILLCSACASQKDLPGPVIYPDLQEIPRDQKGPGRP
jgi:hypothetical protein